MYEKCERVNYIEIIITQLLLLLTKNMSLEKGHNIS